MMECRRDCTLCDNNERTDMKTSQSANARAHMYAKIISRLLLERSSCLTQCYELGKFKTIVTK